MLDSEFNLEENSTIDVAAVMPYVAPEVHCWYCFLLFVVLFLSNNYLERHCAIEALAARA